MPAVGLFVCVFIILVGGCVPGEVSDPTHGDGGTHGGDDSADSGSEDVPEEGTVGAPCFGNGTCNDGLTCRNDVCQFRPTGSEGGPCYGNGTCDTGLDCTSNTCVAETPDAGLPPQGDAGASCAERLPQPGRTLRWPLPASLQVGGGWNTLLTASAGHCLVPAESVTLGGSPDGVVSSLRFHLVESASSLRESLSMEASASFEAGIYQADASASYATEHHVSSYSTYMILETTVSFPPETLSSFVLTENALATLDASSSAFLSQCGDQFVSTVVRGGYYRVVFRFTGLTNHDRQEMSAQLGGSAGIFSTDTQAASTLESFRSRYETNIAVFRSGAPPSSFSGSMAELIQQGFDFASTVTPETAVPIEIGTSSYYTTSNFPACDTLPDYSHEFRTIDELAAEESRSLTVINDIDRRLEIGGRLLEDECNNSRGALLERREEVTGYRALLRAAFDQCTLASAGCAIPIPGFDISLPEIDPNCGPVCATGAGASYASDALGYCTRCEWRPAESVTIQHGGTGFSNVCRFMRPHAQALTRLRIPQVYVNGYGIEGSVSWVELYLDADGSGESSCPVPGSDASCGFTSADGQVYDVGTLSNRIRAHEGEVGAHIFAARCTTSVGDRSCDFSGLVMQICDEYADEALGCSDL